MRFKEAIIHTYICIFVLYLIEKWRCRYSAAASAIRCLQSAKKKIHEIFNGYVLSLAHRPACCTIVPKCRSAAFWCSITDVDCRQRWPGFGFVAFLHFSPFFVFVNVGARSVVSVSVKRDIFAFFPPPQVTHTHIHTNIQTSTYK